MALANYKVEYYEGRDGWRWRLISGNGKTIADSHGATRKMKDCLETLRRFLNEVRLEGVDRTVDFVLGKPEITGTYRDDDEYLSSEFDRPFEVL